MNWNKDTLQVAINVLNRHVSVQDAAEELECRFGELTPDALRRAFNRHGKKNPSYYLCRSSETTSLKGAIGMANAFKVVFNEFIGSKPKEKITKIIVCPDVHIPNEDKKAWKLFLKVLEAVQPDILVTIGDYVDMTSVSRHQKKPKEETRLLPEIVAGRNGLSQIRSVFKGRFVFLAGNHDKRIENFIAEKCPELDELLSLEELLQLKKYDIEYHPYGEIVKIGKMNFVHDTGRCGLNTARQSVLDVGSNIAVGHSHRAAVVYDGTITGDTHVGMNVGCLLDINKVTYTNRAIAKKNWTLGCGFIYQTKDGTSFCTFVPFIKNKCVIDGKLVSL